MTRARTGVLALSVLMSASLLVACGGGSDDEGNDSGDTVQMDDDGAGDGTDDGTDDG